MHGIRSTKAGARTPATRWASLSDDGVTIGAQRRPGREPRRHIAHCPTPGPTARTLNEGRGANPGDTAGLAVFPARSVTAQRRPGREPRRHRHPRHPRHADTPRSTKAGARTPATPPLGMLIPPPTVAQRRPGREPRRHLRFHRGGRERPARSTKAGARTPATRFSIDPCIAPTHRSTKAGARTPATRPVPRRRCSCPEPLNEGRGANPGDTANRCDGRAGPEATDEKDGQMGRKTEDLDLATSCLSHLITNY